MLDQYSFNFIRDLFDAAYAKKFRFPTFLGAFKYYTSYTLKTFDGKRYLERYEDRVCMVALLLAQGNEIVARELMEEIISGPFESRNPDFSERREEATRRACLLLLLAWKIQWRASAGLSTRPCSFPSAAVVSSIAYQYP